MKTLLKILAFLIGLLILATAALYVLSWLSPERPKLAFDDPYHQERKMVTAQNFAVTAGTPWATEAAMDVLQNGGNAVDAAIAGVLMLNVTFGEAASFPGVAPTIFYDASENEVKSYVGAGVAPAKATIEHFRQKGYDKVPDLNILSQLIPASPDVMIRLLQEHGTKSFAELVAPAIKKAKDGFPIPHTTAKNMGLSLPERLAYRFLLPTSSEVYFGERWWMPLQAKDHFKRPMLAETLQELATAEQQALASGASRTEALEALRDYFYSGPIAEKIAAYHQQEDGLITLDDLSSYQSGWETPVVGTYGDYQIFVNGTWTQGIVIPMVLQMVEALDLKGMGHNSAQYVHTLAQAIDLTMADRNAFIADPTFEDIQLEALLSDEFAQSRRAAIQENAFEEMPPSGVINGRSVAQVEIPRMFHTDKRVSSENRFQVGDDTSQIVVADSSGNVIAITPSDFPMSPMIPETGLTMGIRMTQFSLDPENVNRLVPGKRPRITPHAAMVFKNGEFFMAFNTPGGDMQPQALIQVFLNLVVFEMDIQTAIDQPRLKSLNFPSSFDPEDYSPGLLALEAPLYEQIAEGLKAKGYDLKSYEKWDNAFSAVGAIVKENGGIFAGVDPRESGVAAGN